MFPLKMKVSSTVRWRSRVAGWAIALVVAGAAMIECAQGAEPIYLYESLKPEGLRDALHARRERVMQKEIPGLEMMPPAPPVPQSRVKAGSIPTREEKARARPVLRRPPVLDREAVEFLEVYNLWSLANAGQGDGGLNPASREVKRGLRVEAEDLAAELRKLVGKMNDTTLLKVGLQAGNAGMSEALLDAYMERAIDKEVARIVKEPVRKLGFPSNPVDLPSPFSDGLNSAAKAERDEYTRAMAPFARLATERAKKNRILEMDPAARQLDDAFWRGDVHDIAGQMLEFHSESSCGTGMDEAYRWTNRQLVLSLLRERKIPEALGASLLPSGGPKWMRVPGDVVESWRFGLASYCGFREETLLLGVDPHNARWELLAANASVEGARACMAHVQTELGKNEPVWVMEWRWLAGFLAPGFGSGVAEADNDVRSRLAKDLQLEIVGLLGKAIGPDVPFVNLEENLEVFADLMREETKPHLRELLSRPSRTFAEKAAVILREMREEVPKVKEVLPVRLQFSLKGKKMALANLGSVETDEEGLADLSRDFFFDPANGNGNLVFYLHPGPEVLDGSTECAQPFIGAPRPNVDEHGEILKVAFETCEVPLEIEYSRVPPPHVAGMRLRLSRVDWKPQTQNHSYDVVSSKDRPFPAKLRFTTVSPGTYQVAIDAPGSARWKSEPIKVGREMQPYHVRLEQGADLYASVFVPGNAPWPGRFELWRDGVDVTYTYQPFPAESFGHGPIFVGLPRGKYELKARSFEEIIAREGEGRRPSWLREDPPPMVRFESISVSVTIDQETPACLDLGRIDVLPVAADREKATASRQIIFGLESERSP